MEKTTTMWLHTISRSMQYLIIYAALCRWDKLQCHHKNHETKKELIKGKAFALLAVYSWEEPAWHLHPQWSSLHLTANRQVWRKLFQLCRRKRCDLVAFLSRTEKSPCQRSLSVLAAKGRKAWADCLCSRATAALWQRMKGVTVSLINAQGRWQRQ